MKRLSLLVPGLAMAVLCVPADAGLYRIVGEDGTVSYSDRVPPHQAGDGRAEFSKGGLRVREHDPARALEERARLKELERQRHEEERRREQRREADRILLRSFSNEEDILLARDGKLNTYNMHVSVLLKNIEAKKKRLIRLQERVDRAKQGTQPSKPADDTEIAELKQQILQGYGQILNYEAIKQATRAEYARFRTRFRELKGFAEPPGDAALDDEQLQADTAVACEDATECARLWQRAKTYLSDNARTPIAFTAESLIMTAPPDDELTPSLSLSLTPQEIGDGQWILLDVQCRSTSFVDATCPSDEAQAVREGFRPAVIGDARRAERRAPGQTLPRQALAESTATR